MKNIFKKTNQSTTTTTTTKTQGDGNMKNVLNKSNVMKGASIINDVAMIFGAISLVAEGVREIYKYSKEKKQSKKLANLSDCEIESLTRDGLDIVKSISSAQVFEDSTLTILLYNAFKEKDFSKLGEVLSREFEEKEVDTIIERLVELASK